MVPQPRSGVLSARFLALSICILATNAFGLLCFVEPGPPPPGNSGVTGKYVGSERCSQCHFNTHQSWVGTLHAGALTTLEEIGQGSNAECLGCHTVGFGEDGGYVNRATTDLLGSVGCESCHGPGRDHVDNVADVSLRPPVDIGAAVCGRCHTGAHHPTFEQWQQSGHALVTESLANSFSQSSSLNNCGVCHSGDYRFLAIDEGETVPADLLQGKTRAEMNAITCATCHDPHMRTGNAPFADSGRDYQLKFAEVAYPTATNTLAAATDPARFNLCGQCHHTRSSTWQDTSRPPHRSVQSNVYVGEMPVPDGTAALTLSVNSPHALVREQCASCHMHREDFMSELAPAISGHTFEVNFAGCVGSGCHPAAENAQALAATLKNSVQALLDDIRNRLGDPATWEYSCCGGPSDGQPIAGTTDERDTLKKVRWLYYYALYDGSHGVHNPDYTRNMLLTAQSLLTSIGR